MTTLPLSLPPDECGRPLVSPPSYAATVSSTPPNGVVGTLFADAKEPPLRVDVRLVLKDCVLDGVVYRLDARCEIRGVVAVDVEDWVLGVRAGAGDLGKTL